MKKMFFVLALTLALVLSFSAIAGAKYAGYSKEAYLEWTAAQGLYARNMNDVNADQGSAHGNYRTTTAKCFVCHSVHQAPAAASSTSLASAFATNKSLTDVSVGNACTTCHATESGMASTKLIEWGTMYGTTNAGGPHNTFNCTQWCHTSGVHGWSNSEFHGMNVWLLGGAQDAEMRTDFANGNANQEFRRTTRMPNESTNTLFQYVAGGTNYSNVGGLAGPNWFQGGSYGAPAGGKVPYDIEEGAANDTAIFAAAKATATGYTCGQIGCHNDGVFAINTWGFARNANAGDRNNQAAGTLYGNTAAGPMTGHATGNWGYPAHMPSCSPCHPGGAAGGYRYFPGPLNFGYETASNTYRGLAAHGGPGDRPGSGDPAGQAAWDELWDTTFDGTVEEVPGGDGLTYYEALNAQVADARTYGCDQCHDMVGVKTNTTAWPHGNRNIEVYEWTDFGTRDANGQLPLDTWMAARTRKWIPEDGLPATAGDTTPSRSVWMYAGNVARIVGSVNGNDAMFGVPDGSGTKTGDFGASSYWADSLRAAEPSFTVHNGVGSTSRIAGTVVDATCLKCHIPMDAKSAKALVAGHNANASVQLSEADIVAADVASRWHSARRSPTAAEQFPALFNMTSNGPTDPANASGTNTYTASRYIFLYK